MIYLGSKSFARMPDGNCKADGAEIRIQIRKKSKCYKNCCKKSRVMTAQYSSTTQS